MIARNGLGARVVAWLLHRAPLASGATPGNAAILTAIATSLALLTTVTALPAVATCSRDNSPRRGCRS